MCLRRAVFVLLLFHTGVIADTPSDVVIKADFRWGSEGWSAIGPAGSSWEVAAESAQLRGSDDDDSIWLAGDLSEAYGGHITFTLGHTEYNSLGLGVQDEFDLQLVSSVHNLTLGHKHVVPGWVTSSQNVVELSEDGGWVDTETSESATLLTFLMVLSNLSAVRVRGGFYRGHEHTFLSEVILSRGKHAGAPWLRKCDPCLCLGGTNNSFSDGEVDQLCQFLRLSPLACEQYAAHLVDSFRSHLHRATLTPRSKLNVESLRQQYDSQYAAFHEAQRTADTSSEAQRQAIQEEQRGLN